MRRIVALSLAFLSVLTLSLASCGNEDAVHGTDDTDTADLTDISESTGEETEKEKELQPQMELTNVKTIKIDEGKKHQTVESFGASGAWWSQYVGAWDDIRLDGSEVREYIAKLLFDKKDGIGLNCYRYNIGGGSRESHDADISDKWRRASSFETEPGVYDWSRDEAAVWMMKRAVEYGVDEIVMFCNSPPERLTVSGKAHALTTMSSKSNISPKNYDEFVKYVLDVAEHFKNDEGLPVKFISPINEPQWEWTGGQEGCHYENNEVVSVLRKFVKGIGERASLDGVEITGPEGGEWKNATTEMCKLILNDKTLGEYFDTLDVHSYWSDSGDKKAFAAYFNKKFPGIKYRCSEWCEMVNGKDTTMSSALNLANQIYEDMTILDCTSWQYWIAVSCYDYRDGLVYVDTSSRKVTVPKRLWAMGNYSRFIDRGYVRIEAESDVNGANVSVYEGVNENGLRELVAVIVNERNKSANIGFDGVDASVYKRISVNVTDKEHDLEEIYYSSFESGTAVTVPASSVTTVVISEINE